MREPEVPGLRGHGQEPVLRGLRDGARGERAHIHAPADCGAPHFAEERRGGLGAQQASCH
eukprot:3409541-Alexandrium_andersonii.AAC.1